MKEKKIPIYKKYFDMIVNREKTLEIRVAYNSLKSLKEGDILVFINKSKIIRTKIIRISNYYSFSEMLKSEDIKKINPYETYDEQLHSIKNIYPPIKEKLGVIVFEILCI